MFLDSVYPESKSLADELINNCARFQTLRSKRVIFDDHQWEKLFPPLGDPPDSKTFDITLLHLLIREVCYLPAPSTGWHEMPSDDDDSLAANITELNASEMSCVTVSQLAFLMTSLKTSGTRLFLH